MGVGITAACISSFSRAFLPGHTDAIPISKGGSVFHSVVVQSGMAEHQILEIKIRVTSRVDDLEGMGVWQDWMSGAWDTVW